MNDLRELWVIMLGRLYFSGLGQAFGQAVPGQVFSQLRKNAFVFTSLEEAKVYAEAIGGQVFRA